MFGRIALILTFAATAFASRVAPMQLGKLADQSTLIVIGTVIRTRTTEDTSAYTEKLATVRVVRVMQGTYTETTLRVRTRTGLIFFDRHLEEGDGGVLFLKASPRGDFEAAYPGSFALFRQGTFATSP